jgi:hypothetical protein
MLASAPALLEVRDVQQSFARTSGGERVVID